MGMRGSSPLEVSGSVDGIELTVGVFPQRAGRWCDSSS